MDEAERCTEIGLIYAGRLIASGTPTQIKALVPGHLVEFTPALLAPAQECVAGMAGVLEVQTYGERLHIFVDDTLLPKTLVLDLASLPTIPAKIEGLAVVDTNTLAFAND